MSLQLPATTAPAALLAPIVRLWRLTTEEKAASAIAGIFAFLVDPVFHVGIGCLLFLNCWDWIVGVRLAKYEDAFDGAIAFNGALSKLTAVVLVVALRVLEGWAPAAGIAPTGVTAGIIASGAIFGLCVVEFKSIGEKQVKLGSGSLAPLFRALDRISGGRSSGGGP